MYQFIQCIFCNQFPGNTLYGCFGIIICSVWNWKCCCNRWALFIYAVQHVFTEWSTLNFFVVIIVIMIYLLKTVTKHNTSKHKVYLCQDYHVCTVDM